MNVTREMLKPLKCANCECDLFIKLVTLRSYKGALSPVPIFEEKTVYQCINCNSIEQGHKTR